jgi:hypothetical protein
MTEGVFEHQKFDRAIDRGQQNGDPVSLVVPFLRLARSEGPGDERGSDLDRLPDLSVLLDCGGNQYHAILNRIIPIVHARLMTVAKDVSIPQDLHQYIRINALKAIAGHMFREHWLHRILEQSEAAGIPIILLKGAAFQNYLYSTSEPRLGCDFDLLTKQSDFARMCNVMAETMTAVFDTKRRYSHETAFQWMFQSGSSNGPIIEIHRAITTPYIFSISEENLWAHSRPHPAYNSDLIRILSPEDNVLHLAVHAFRDLNYCNHNLLDTHEVWRQWKPDVNLLLERSRAWGANGALYFLLLGARRLMDTPVPDSLLERLAPSPIRRLIIERILASSIIRSGQHFHPAYRLLQTVSQLTVPRNPFRGLLFHLDYAKSRVLDLYASLRSD